MATSPARRDAPLTSTAGHGGVGLPSLHRRSASAPQSDAVKANRKSVATPGLLAVFVLAGSDVIMIGCDRLLCAPYYSCRLAPIGAASPSLGTAGH